MLMSGSINGSKYKAGKFYENLHKLLLNYTLCKENIEKFGDPVCLLRISGIFVNS